MRSGSGYEYRYGVSLNEEGFEKPPCRTYILEVRTNFILKSIGPDAEETLVDTEKFSDRLPVDDFLTHGVLAFEQLNGKNMVDNHLRSRLSKYCMPVAQIRALAQAAFDLVRDPQYNSLHTIPVLVVIDVYTVQLEGEPLDATLDRSIKPDVLIPLQLRWTWKNSLNDLPFLRYLGKLPTVRVREDGDDGDVDKEAIIESCPICLNSFNFILQKVSLAEQYACHEKHCVGRKEGLALMEVCPICLREPIVGAQIASLPCKHVFHDHCFIRWLLKSQSCPVCRLEIVIKKNHTSKLLKP